MIWHTSVAVQSSRRQYRRHTTEFPGRAQQHRRAVVRIDVASQEHHSDIRKCRQSRVPVDPAVYGSAFPLYRQQLVDLHCIIPGLVGEEGEAVGDRLCRIEIVGLDDRVAGQVAGCSFRAVIANGDARPERAADLDESRADLSPSRRRTRPSARRPARPSGRTLASPGHGRGR